VWAQEVINYQENDMGLLDILTGMQNGPRGQRPPGTSTGSSGGMSKLTMALIALLAYKALKSRGGSSGHTATANEAGGAPPLPRAGTDSPSGGLGDILGGLLGGTRTASAGAKPGGAPSLPGAGTAGPSGGPSGGLGDILGGLFGGTRTAPAGAKPAGGLADMLPGGLGGLLGGAAAGSVLTSGLGNLIKDLQQSGHGQVANSWVGSGANQEIAPDQLEKALGTDTLNTLAQHTGMSPEELLRGLSQNLPDLVDQLTPHGRLPTEHEAGQMV
jgi:uncharacterized protein YidB (DUF937 family)